MNNEKIVLVRLLGHANFFFLPEKNLSLVIYINDSGSDGVSDIEFESQGFSGVWESITQLRKMGLPIQIFHLHQFDENGNFSGYVLTCRVAPKTLPRPTNWGSRKKLEVIDMCDRQIAQLNKWAKLK